MRSKTHSQLIITFCPLTFDSKMREQKVIRANSDYEMSRAKSENEFAPHSLFTPQFLLPRNHFQICSLTPHSLIEIPFVPPPCLEQDYSTDPPDLYRSVTIPES